MSFQYLEVHKKPTVFSFQVLLNTLPIVFYLITNFLQVEILKSINFSLFGQILQCFLFVYIQRKTCFRPDSNLAF